MPWSDKQRLALFRSNARVNIAEGAVSSGKSHAYNWRFLMHIHEMREAGKFDHMLITGKTEETVRRNVIAALENIIDGVVYKQGLATIAGIECNVIGANDEKAETKIRGATFAGWLGDEVSLYPRSFVDMALTRLRVPKAKAYWTTNPDSPHHYLKRDFIDRADNRDISTHHFVIDDNPILDPEYRASLDRMYTGVFKRRMIDGEWVIAEGCIYSYNPDRDDYDEKEIEGKRPDMMIIAGDIGYINPTTFGLYRRIDGTIYKSREYWHSGEAGKSKTDREYANDFEQMYGDVKNQLDAVKIDPSATSFINELQARGWPVIRSYRDDSGTRIVNERIRSMALWIDSGRFRLDKSCANTKRERLLYAWDTKHAERTGEDKPIKQDDHTQDCDGYAVAYFDAHRMRRGEIDRYIP